MSDDRPSIRALDVQRTDGPEGPGIVLIDRLGISEPTFLPEAALPIAGRCTGELTVAEIHEAAQKQYEAELTLDEVQSLLQQLDERLLLEGPRFEAAVTAAAEAFCASGVRAPSHAGSAGCPADPTALRRALDAMLGDDAAKSPGAPIPQRAAIRGLVAPHIDLARGADGYAHAYRELVRRGPADLYVIFGTGHAGPSRPVTGLGLDWQTSLGTAVTDRAFVQKVHALTGPAAPQDLLIHRGEHSIEFQVLWLQHLHQRFFDDRPFRVAGFLCGQLPSKDGDPLREQWLEMLLDAFREAERETDGELVYIAGADLAHIGPMFGDEQPIDDTRLRRLETDERARLDLLQRGNAGAFHQAVVATGNPDRVCSAPAITLCAALSKGSGELHHYGQARASDDQQTVSFCAMTFARGGPASAHTAP